jgi:hypothetical protein
MEIFMVLHIMQNHIKECKQIKWTQHQKTYVILLFFFPFGLFKVQLNNRYGSIVSSRN